MGLAQSLQEDTALQDASQARLKAALEHVRALFRMHGIEPFRQTLDEVARRVDGQALRSSATPEKVLESLITSARNLKQSLLSGANTFVLVDAYFSTSHETGVDSTDAALVANFVLKGTGREPLSFDQWQTMSRTERLAAFRPPQTDAAEKLASLKRPRETESPLAAKAARTDLTVDELMAQLLPRVEALDNLRRLQQSLPFKYHSLRVALKQNQDNVYSIYSQFVAYNLYRSKGDLALNNVDIESDLYARLLIAKRRVKYEDTFHRETIKHIHVPLFINGEKIMAIVDTGASSSAMSTDLAQRLGLERMVDVSSEDIVGGVGSQVSPGIVYDVAARISADSESLEWGESIRIKCILVDTLRFDMLLGLDVLSNYDSTIDIEHNEVTFVMGGKRVRTRLVDDVQEYRVVQLVKEHLLRRNVPREKRIDMMNRVYRGGINSIRDIDQELNET